MKRVLHSSHWGSFYARIENGRIVGTEAFEGDADPSAILDAVPEMVHGRTRVFHPMVRRGWLEGGPDRARERRGADEFVRVSFDEAIGLVAGELDRVRSSHGNQALFTGSYGWSSAGRFHHAKSHLLRFMNLFGGSTRQINSYSYAAAQTLLPHVLGDARAALGLLSSWDGIAENTRLMVCFGGISPKNAQVQAGGFGEHIVRDWLARCRRRGVGFINIGPLRDDMDESIDAEWLPVRPGSDTALILALCHVLLTEGRHDRAFLASHCTGFDAFADYLLGLPDGIPKTPAWAAEKTCIAAAAIVDLARRMATNRTMIAMTWALQRAEHGEQPYWAAIALAAMLGQIGLPGGGFGFGYGATNGKGNPRRPVSIPTLPTGSNPIRSAIPVARISDMLLSPGEEYAFDGGRFTYPDTRLVYWAGGNPFHHHQDLNRLVKAFRRPDTVVVNECWWTATARHADIVLPATTTLERNDIAAAQLDRFLVAMKQAVEPLGEARSDFDIFAALASRFGFRETFTEGRTEAEWLAHLYETNRASMREEGIDLPGFADFWAHGHVEIPLPDAPFTLYEDFRADPEAHRLATPSGRIEIFSETIAGFGYRDCPGHPAWIEPNEWLGAKAATRFPLHLVSNQPATRLHSQMDAGGASAGSKIAGREPLRLNPADATARGLRPGDIVRAWNDRGELLAGLVVSDDVMPGVAQLATGAWYDPLEPFGLDKHGNPNVLTADRPTSLLSQAPAAHSCLIEVEKWLLPLPAITAHDGPPTRR